MNSPEKSAEDAAYGGLRMREIPILFCGDMVRAILDGRKTMTRRIRFTGKAGDILWVRETWAKIYDTEAIGFDDDGKEYPFHYEYRADFKDNKYPGEWPDDSGSDPDCPKWRPSIFMPKDACRIRLVVMSVSQQMLCHISPNDARSEGFDSTNEFRKTWDKLNKKRGYGWDKNPDIYVTSFKRI